MLLFNVHVENNITKLITVAHLFIRSSGGTGGWDKDYFIVSSLELTKCAKPVIPAILYSSRDHKMKKINLIYTAYIIAFAYFSFTRLVLVIRY